MLSPCCVPTHMLSLLIYPPPPTCYISSRCWVASLFILYLLLFASIIPCSLFIPPLHYTLVCIILTCLFSVHCVVLDALFPLPSHALRFAFVAARFLFGLTKANFPRVEECVKNGNRKCEGNNLSLIKIGIMNRR